MTAVIAGKRFLIAEDNAFTRSALCELLGVHGAMTVLAENGEEAIRIFDSSEEGFFDTVMLDVCMPQMDGYAAASAIRRMGRRDAQIIPIFALTGASPVWAREEAERNGIDICLQKPIAVRDLARLLACMTGIGRSEQNSLACMKGL